MDSNPQYHQSDGEKVFSEVNAFFSETEHRIKLDKLGRQIG